MADLLAFQPLTVETCPEREQGTFAVRSGTRLILEGVQIPQIAAALRERARGFPIAVQYNGEALPRPQALAAERR